MVLSDLTFQNSQRNARRALRRETEQPARASSNLSLRPEDSASNIGLAMQEVMLGWPQQYVVPSTPQSTVSQQRSATSRKPLTSTMAQSIPFPIHYPPPPSSVYSQPSQNPYAAITAANPYINASPQYQQAQLSNQPWLHQPNQFMLTPPALPIPSPHPMAPHSEANVHPALRRIHTEPAAPSSSPSTSPTLINTSSTNTAHKTTTSTSTAWPTHHRERLAELRARGLPVSQEDLDWAEMETRGEALQAKLDKAHDKAKEELRWMNIGFRGRMKERWARNK